MDEKSIKYVKLNRNRKFGFGFSIIGGAGSELPPIIYDIISGSPAATCKKLQPGDVILEVNGQPVKALTTKEVLNCLRDSPDEITLKLRTDRGAEERVRQLLEAPNDPKLLRQAITQEELQGVNRIVGKRDALPGSGGAVAVPPPLPAKATSPPAGSGAHGTGSLDRRGRLRQMQQHPAGGKMKNGCLDDSFEEGEERFESCIDISQAATLKSSKEGLHQRQASSDGGERLAGELVLDLSKTNDIASELTKCGDSKSLSGRLIKFGDSRSVPNSPGGIIDAVCNSSLSNSKRPHKIHESRYSCTSSSSTPTHHHHNNTNNNHTSNSNGQTTANACDDCGDSDDSSSASPVCVSCDSPVSAVAMMTASSGGGSFTYSPPAVRISRSEDQLQCPDDGDMGSINTDLEDDVTASLNTLLDTREEDEAYDELQRQQQLLKRQSSSPSTTSPVGVGGNNTWLMSSSQSATCSATTITTTCATATASTVVTTLSHSTPVTVVAFHDLQQQQHHSAEHISGSALGPVNESAVSIPADVVDSTLNVSTDATLGPALSPSESVHSSHDSDSPLLRSPSPPQSPHSPVSPSSSVPFSSSGVYDQMRCGRDPNLSGRSGGNVCSNSSSVTTSPDTDIPDELEWDETTPSYVPTSSLHALAPSGGGGGTKQALLNGHNTRGGGQTLRSSPRHASSVNASSSSATQHHRNLVSVDTSSSSSSSLILHEKVKRKKDENRIVIKVAGPDKSSSSSTLGQSNNSIKSCTARRHDSSSSIGKSTSSSRRLRKAGAAGSIVSSTGVTSALTTSQDGGISPSVASVLTSSCGAGVIPGVDPDVTPTNTPHQTPPLSPTRSLKHQRAIPEHDAMPRQSSTRTSPPLQVSPQTPGSGTLSPETLAYQQLWESEDEFTTSCISEDDASLTTSRSLGAVSAKSHGSKGSHQSLSHSHSHSQHSSSSGGSTVAGPAAAAAGGGNTDGSGGATVGSKAASSATSPPLSEDESDIESLHSFHYSPKAVDIPSAVRLAKRLYHLDGFKKTDVSRHLSKNNEFSRAVAEEYLQHFDFGHRTTLDEALRCFLERFCLTGETQERERVLVHFSRRYLDCNPGTFNSQDAVHTLTCALMLLNTDLHGAGAGTGRAMTCSEFINNLAELNDGQDFSPQVLRDLHAAIKRQPLKWAVDEAGEGGASEELGSAGETPPALLGSNPFLAPASGDGIIYKKGYIMRKCCTDPNGKKTSFGKRSWKMWWCVVQDLVLYLYKDEQCGRRSAQHAPPPQLGSQAIRLHHALATRAHDYNKKQHVFRLLTADQAEYLLQTSDSKELQGWIDTINFVAASLSAPPMAGAVGSQKKFQRPLLPCSITKLNLRDQTADHQKRLLQLEAELEQHSAKPPDKAAKSNALSNYREKETYLNEEIKRYRAYVYLLRSRLESSSDGLAVVAGLPPPPDLPVFQAGDDPVDPVVAPGTDGVGVGSGNGRVVPPPIPDRGGRPGAAGAPTDSAGPAVGKNPFEDGDTVECSKGGSSATQSNGGAEANNKGADPFKKELVKVKKEQEKREQKKQEKDKKEQEKKSKKNQQLEEKERRRDKRRIVPETSGGDARMGTMNRLSALFKFSKMNRPDEVVVTEGVEEAPPSPPPLPPKPAPNSPIMTNVGTRFDL